MCAKTTIEDQIKVLDAAIASGGCDSDMADMYYRRGLLLWRTGRRGDAMSDYNRAIGLDATSPAVQALAMSQEIMDFYNKDLYNP